MPDTPHGPSRITHGTVHVLAYLHEADATCHEVAREIVIAESTTHRWLTELAAVGILEADAVQRPGGPVTVYCLDDDELGAAAQVVVDRL